MNTLIPTTTLHRARRADSWLLPAAATLLLHGGAIGMLYSSWSPEPPASAPPSVMVMQLVTLPSPAPEPPTVEPEPLPEPVVEAEPPAPLEPQVDQAAIARKRLEEQQERERQEQQRLVEQRRQQEQEQQRHDQQQRELAEQYAREEQQRLAAEAEAQRLADAEAARRAAEAAAIAQYQPISKKPPTYPRRALDKQLEGDCTVSYTVTRDGRVSNPQVIDSACDDPLFARPSLAAAKSFRYQPRVINGQAVAVDDVRNTFRYRIQ
ncbi:outer membrane transport energization protein TonB [Halopseudomonas litoralis]|uniref:Protein TonB n=1 Tax=Halopseudomonas litoralis TaxID=797277 RepID=A0A1H1XGC5_9GAMM|nr:energy transducer TonB [Halopseudomonas litoralis]SDT08335.1 outer membrane transport energization protein TonB [Halopseudomonas litoralis]